MWLSRNEHWNTQKVCISYHVWKVLILWKIWICLNNCYWSNQKNGININKNFFSPQTEPHTVKLYLSVVLKHFLGKFIENFSFLDTKVTLSKKITEILRKFVFLTMFEKEQILRKIWICLKNWFEQTCKRG